MKVSLMDRKSNVYRSTPAMDESCARESQVDQSGPEEVERHLVGHSCSCRIDGAQHTEVVCHRFGEKYLFYTTRTGAVPQCSALVPEIQLATGCYLGMAGNDL